ncbi:MAG TPA: glucose-6-phosphate dehydrogenase [Steroidobacteraceae bacterium]|nr:glucose-6-phosphate dehydrogenase [Steroidobacteraceae bacterium]
MPAGETFDIVLFGATGDLATRKLLPALYRRHKAGQFAAKSRVLGVSNKECSREEFIAGIVEPLKQRVGSEFTETSWQKFIAQLDYVKVDVRNEMDFQTLKEKLQDRDDIVRVYFLSTSPLLFVDICKHLNQFSLVTSRSRVVLEKPLGHDLASSNEINENVTSAFNEEQIYRIDHYLGKEPVQNLMALRFGNTLFEPLWKRGRIRHVQITVAEQVGVEGRASFYDKTGALRDMVQNHLLQLLCIIAMEPPSSSKPDDVRDEKLKVLRALRPLQGSEAIEHTVRGQYIEGAIAGMPVPGYLDEPGVAPDSTTETFVALRAYVDSWRWAGVPFYLRTGKRMQERVAEIVITFEEVPHAIFDRPNSDRARNRLVIRLQPDEHITLTLLAKTPGEGIRLKPVNLGLDLAGSQKEKSLDAYERLMMDVVKGNLTLFMRRDELDAAWRWIDPIRESWLQQDEPPKLYTAGTWGPAASTALISRDGLSWHGEL